MPFSNRTGQAAIEFLMSYGWAILVVLVAIGALSYLGFSNIKDTIGIERCLLPLPFTCLDASISEGTVSLLLKYNGHDEIELEQMSLKDLESTNLYHCLTNLSMSPNDEQIIICQTNFTNGVNGEILLSYSTRNLGLTHNDTGRLQLAQNH